MAHQRGEENTLKTASKSAKFVEIAQKFRLRRSKTKRQKTMFALRRIFLVISVVTLFFYFPSRAPILLIMFANPRRFTYHVC